ncbi:alpha/beta fold hydrolase [Antrihabitans sp. YC2-6]|uniref:alpha/beta fold hydrolase n=1 Tax=Antrihabitans sp. YC2-6 TaxID=2799498 RepID=UPI0018F5F3DA|nr:alpha/beta hydrolase [Antrihabitans sp. YC2-6]MBJ8347241.1 alpha/beta fold hydrolase [Antrihabitans sp. YC2-6]
MNTTTLTEKTVSYDGTQIFFAEAGTGPAIVLLHGGGPGATGTSNYSKNIAELAKSFRVIVPDMPGYGRSTRQTDKSNPLGFVADSIRGMLDVLEIEKASLVGNSWGGACALRLALDSPHRVERLVLMGPGGVGTTKAPPTAGLRKLLDYYRGAGPSRERLDEFIRTYLVYDSDSVPAHLIDDRYRDSIDPESIAHFPLRRPSSLSELRVMRRMDFTRDPRLAQLTTPTLVIWGAEDKINRPNGGRILARTMPNCDLLLAANTGHWVQWERAEMFNDVVRTFLAPTA